MRRLCTRAAMALILCVAMLLAQASGPARAEGEAAGEFDYYVMALSWSSAWCALEDDARDDDQCDPRHDYTFTLHGLWPQHDTGWPSYCLTKARDPSRAQSAAMADIMGSGGLAWYQWKKHGRCSGLSAEDYYDTARRAYDAITIPPVFAKVTRSLKVPALVIEDAFLDANPGLTASMITITCTQGMIREARVCLTKDLTPRTCGPDVIRDCTLSDAVLEAVR